MTEDSLLSDNESFRTQVLSIYKGPCDDMPMSGTCLMGVVSNRCTCKAVHAEHVRAWHVRRGRARLVRDDKAELGAQDLAGQAHEVLRGREL